jgi:hypothetical protein
MAAFPRSRMNWSSRRARARRHEQLRLDPHESDSARRVAAYRASERAADERERHAGGALPEPRFHRQRHPQYVGAGEGSILNSAPAQGRGDETVGSCQLVRQKYRTLPRIVTGIVNTSGTEPRATVHNQQEVLSLTLASYTVSRDPAGPTTGGAADPFGPAAQWAGTKTVRGCWPAIGTSPVDSFFP